MKIGSPPTAPNARAGLLTPPGITCLARSNAAWLLDRCMRRWVWEPVPAGWGLGEDRFGLRDQFGDGPRLARVQVADVAEFVSRVTFFHGVVGLELLHGTRNLTGNKVRPCGGVLRFAFLANEIMRPPPGHHEHGP